MNYIRLQGYSVGSSQNLEEFVDAIEKNDLKPVIDSVFDFEESQKAFQKLKSGEAFGKIVLKVE
jgi:NADPH:quinone reductase-like Zn-dependent oxidoreductase